jgi:hypothetical protein
MSSQDNPHSWLEDGLRCREPHVQDVSHSDQYVNVKSHGLASNFEEGPARAISELATWPIQHVTICTRLASSAMDRQAYHSTSSNGLRFGGSPIGVGNMVWVCHTALHF